MPFSAEVICVKDHNEDHEVGGLDLPVVVTLATAPQHTAAQSRWWRQPRSVSRDRVVQRSCHLVWNDSVRNVWPRRARAALHMESFSRNRTDNHCGPGQN